jgi:gentisate 1,2-dioxygenase
MSTDSEPKARFWDDDIEDQVRAQDGLKKDGRIVARAEELVWGDTKMGHNSLAVSPLTGFPIHTMHAHIDEIAPGGKTGLHRHASEAIMLCVSGSGYTTIDDVRYEWKSADCFVVPAGTWHQHFNASATEAARYFAVSNWPLTVEVGLSYLETAEKSDRYAQR